MSKKTPKPVDRTETVRALVAGFTDDECLMVRSALESYAATMRQVDIMDGTDTHEQSAVSANQWAAAFERAIHARTWIEERAAQ
jgi:hypothetical protein